ncbi:antigen WC1.1-like [Platysternon megacephalum]|uniref:Antigen WC1.1-like n=1 Tax=Platysternon megacephalum TaxID=55544 RepID=A0A4D9DSG0_9SAUR|nr:antigen WC1.1-like [Platysternon megacephalum]
MDRVSSSMKQVPNPLPKVLSRRGGGGGGGGLEAEREGFERSQGSILPFQGVDYDQNPFFATASASNFAIELCSTAKCPSFLKKQKGLVLVVAKKTLCRENQNAKSPALQSGSGSLSPNIPQIFDKELTSPPFWLQALLWYCKCSFGNADKEPPFHTILLGTVTDSTLSVESKGKVV